MAGTAGWGRSVNAPPVFLLPVIVKALELPGGFSFDIRSKKVR